MSYIKNEDREKLQEVTSFCEKSILPKDITTWLENNVFKEHRYIFYKAEKNKCFGYCQNCGFEGFEFKHTKKQKFLTCPKCHRKMKLRNIKYQNCRDSAIFMYLEKMSENMFVIRYFDAIRETCFLEHKYRFYERQRFTFCVDSDGYAHTPQYYREYNSDWTIGQWKYMNVIFPDYGFLYYKNLDILNFHRLKYLPFKQYTKKHKIDLYEVLRAVWKYEQIEYLMKLGLSHIVDYIYYHGDYKFNLATNNIKRFLRLNGEYYKYCLKINPTMVEYDSLRELQEMKIKPTKRNLEFQSFFGYLYKKEILLNYMTYNSLQNYYYKVLKTKENLKDYVDYLECAKELKYDLTNTKYLKPKNFKLAHDMAFMKRDSIKNKSLYLAVKKQCKKYLKLSYENKNYSIVMPTKAEDIIQEGIDNKNCVGTYLGRIKKGNSIICFVRHTNDLSKSFYTLELDPKTLNIVQCRGFNNGKTSEEDKVQSFVKKWQKEVVLKKIKLCS